MIDLELRERLLSIMPADVASFYDGIRITEHRLWLTLPQYRDPTSAVIGLCQYMAQYPHFGGSADLVAKLEAHWAR